jgi:hypothetical protein
MAVDIDPEIIGARLDASDVVNRRIPKTLTLLPDERIGNTQYGGAD